MPIRTVTADAGRPVLPSKTTTYHMGCGSCSWFGALPAALIVLKLAGVISLSWPWVLLPIWIGPALVVAFVGTILVGALGVLLVLALLLAIEAYRNR